MTMCFLRRILATAALILLPSLAMAQGASQWLGPATGGHLVMTAPFGRPGQTMDAGGSTAAGGVPLNSVSPSSLPSGVAFVNSGQSLALYSGYATGTYSQVLFGFDGNGGALFTVNSVGGGNANCSWSINGTLYPCASAGGGNVVGPNSSNALDLALFSGTTGKLLSGSGFTAINPNATDGQSGALNGNAIVLWTPTMGTISTIDHSVGMFMMPTTASYANMITVGDYPATFNMKWGNTGAAVPAGTKGMLTGYECNITSAQVPADQQIPDMHCLGGTLVSQGGAGGEGIGLIVNSATVTPGANLWVMNAGITCAVAGGCLNHQGIQMTNNGSNQLGIALIVGGNWARSFEDQAPSTLAENGSAKGFWVFGDSTFTNPAMLIGNTGGGKGFVGTVSNHPVDVLVNNVAQWQLGSDGILHLLNTSAIDANTANCFSLTGSNGCIIFTNSSGTQIKVPFK